MIRWVFASVGAISLTALLCWALASLVFLPSKQTPLAVAEAQATVVQLTRVSEPKTPEPKKPEPKKPEPKKPEPKKPEPKKPEPKKPEPKKPEPKKPEPKKPEPKNPEPKNPEPKNPEPKTPEPSNPSSAPTQPSAEPSAPAATAPVLAALEPLARQEPIYPRRAKRRKVEGDVVVSVRIEADGRVQLLTIVSSSPRGVFDQAVRDALSGWRYPVDYAGQQQTLAFVFRLHS